VIKNSVPIYRDGSVLATVTGMTIASKNKKTGPLLQVKFMAENIEPHDALRSGDDGRVCFGCPLSSPANGGNGDCYVLVFQGPLAVYRAVQDMPTETDPVLPDRGIRLGEYGDPASVPRSVLDKLVSPTKKYPNGRPSCSYTHQWRERKDLADICMASVASSTEATQAQKKGFRTYRVLPTEDTPLMDNEIMCPHTGPKQVQCADCMLCSGNKSKAKNIAVVAL